ncbi:MAG TPA: cytochrome c3 family protein [Xanthomonadales bacterium]|nr:cytochrome c3 family protein [Xanthomonadales bacterium]
MIRAQKWGDQAGQARGPAPAGLRTAMLALLAGVGLALASVASGQEQAALSEQHSKCLACHSMPALSKALEDGGKLSLHVVKDDYAVSAHRMFGCTSCHANVDPAAHPAMHRIASAQAYSIERSQVCGNCHAAAFEQYQDSVHASLVTAGDPAAPVCSSCHDPHAVRPAAAEQVDSAMPCASCHQEIFDAYEGSVHGQARVGAGQAHAPICMDCHQAHNVSAVAGGDRLKATCLECHDNALAAHDQWLPNSRLHLDVVSCPACHSPMADRAIELMLYDQGSQELVAEVLDDPQFEARARAIDVAGDGLDPLELWTLVREINREGGGAKFALRGRMEVPSGPQAHRLAIKLEAVRDCETCHQSGAEPFRKVTVSVAGSDGRRVKYEASENTLTSGSSVDSVGGFYTAGGTRIGLLDALLALAVIAGLGIPLVHLMVRRYFRKNR